MFSILLLQILSLCSFLGFYIYFSKKDISNLCCYLFFITSTLILITYILGFIGFLNIGTLLIHVTGVALFIFNLKNFFKLNNYKSQAPIYAFLICIVFITLGLYFTGARIYYWDDLTHWAIVSRDLFVYDKFPSPVNGSDFYVDYPPGTALFHYYFLYPLKILSPINYIETSALLGQSIIIISSGLCFIKLSLTKFKFYNLFVALTILILVFTGSEGLNSLMVDSLIGIYFGAAIFLTINGKTNFDFLNVVLACLTISLFKPTGILFSLTIAYILAITIIYKKYNGDNSSTITNYNWKKILFIFLVLIAAIFSMKFSWNIYVDSVSSPVWNYKFKFKDLYFLFSNASDDQKQIISNFYNAITPNFNLVFKDFIRSSENYIFQYYFYLIILITLYSLIKVKNNLFNLIFLNIFITFIGYCSVLLFTYLFLFTTPDGLALASFSRYVSSFSICLVLFVYTIIFNNQFKNYKFCLILILLPLLINPIYISRISHAFYANPNIKTIRMERVNYENLILQHPFLRLKSSKIILVSECTGGYDRLLLSYDLFPAKVSRFPQLSPNCKSDTLTFGKSPIFDNFDFNEHDFIIVVNSSTWFINSYGKYFDNIDGTFPMLFKISSHQDTIKFIRIK
jgi:hypothetical protein